MRDPIQRWRAATGRTLAVCAAISLTLSGAAPGQESGDAELYRLRVTNAVDGPVQVSANGGRTWQSLGKVTRAASTHAASSAVLNLAPAGCVGGATPEQLLIRVGTVKEPPKSLRILARGQTGNAAALLTDIPARGPLFRYLAPPIGSRVLLERDEITVPLPTDYLPREGDRLLILVTGSAAAESPTVTLENRLDGTVVLTTTGGTPQLLGKVKQPFRGIGRYAGTERAGNGSVVGWSPTMVLVSTAARPRKLDPMGEPLEERGGFVIQPAEPQLKGATNPASQMVIEAVPGAGSRPIASPFFGLPIPLSSGDPLDPAQSRVEVRLDGGPWEAMPDLRGPVPEDGMVKAVQDAVGGGRQVREGITHIRFRYGRSLPASLERRIRLSATPASPSPQRGQVTVTANVMGEGIVFVGFYLNGTLSKLTNQPPFNWEWNTAGTPNGEHLIEIRGMDDKLAVVSTVTTRVLVDN